MSRDIKRPIRYLSIEVFSPFFRKTVIHATALILGPEKPNCGSIERSLPTHLTTKAVPPSFPDNPAGVHWYRRSRQEIRRTACLLRKPPRRSNPNRLRRCAIG